MAVKTLGTNATTSLNALAWSSNMSAADLAALAQSIKDDVIATHPVYPNAFVQAGRLYVPNRGSLQLRPGDWVAVDPTTGWPILLSALAIASGPFTHT